MPFDGLRGTPCGRTLNLRTEILREASVVSGVLLELRRTRNDV